MIYVNNVLPLFWGGAGLNTTSWIFILTSVCRTSSSLFTAAGHSVIWMSQTYLKIFLKRKPYRIVVNSFG